MAENFPTLIRDMKPQIQEAWKTLSKINTPKSTLFHIIFKLQKTKHKQKLLKEAWDENKTKARITLPTEKHSKNYTSLQKSCYQEKSGEKYVKCW